MSRRRVVLDYESLPREPPQRDLSPWVWCGIAVIFLSLLAGGFFGVPEWIADRVAEAYSSDR